MQLSKKSYWCLKQTLGTNAIALIITIPIAQIIVTENAITDPIFGILIQGVILLIIGALIFTASYITTYAILKLKASRDAAKNPDVRSIIFSLLVSAIIFYTILLTILWLMAES
jgi:hypothetical protein